jgi:hypothetical protein
MTGPRNRSLHQCPRRPWLLLPFLVTVSFLPMACSDHPTESSLSVDGSTLRRGRRIRARCLAKSRTGADRQ